MSVCPFCKAPVPATAAPCPKCGREASDHPSIAAVQGRTIDTDFDDEPAGELSLELDVPNAPRSGTTTSSALAYGDDPGDPFDSVPDLPAAPSSSRQRPSGSHPLPGNSGTLPAARPTPDSDPRISAPDVDAFDAAGRGPPSSAKKIPVPSSGRLPASSPAIPGAPESGEVLARPAARPGRPPPDPGALVVARYPPPPSGVVEMPGYACRVLVRRFELRRDLEALRRRRSPDVPLYEAALEAHDARAFALGLAITAALVFLGLLVFFSPVIARFLVTD